MFGFAGSLAAMATQLHFVKRPKSPQTLAKRKALTDADVTIGDPYFWWFRNGVKFYSPTAVDRVILGGGVEEG
jgi:hypothetical protein